MSIAVPLGELINYVLKLDERVENIGIRRHLLELFFDICSAGPFVVNSLHVVLVAHEFLDLWLRRCRLLLRLLRLHSVEINSL